MATLQQMSTPPSTSACDHELRRDVLLEDGQMQHVRYCVRKGCNYREVVEGDPRRSRAA